MDKVFYNESSALKLGWEPDWFGATDFDEVLTKKITQFQKSLGLSADGLCGPCLSGVSQSTPPMCGAVW